MGHIEDMLAGGSIITRDRVIPGPRLPRPRLSRTRVRASSSPHPHRSPLLPQFGYRPPAFNPARVREQNLQQGLWHNVDRAARSTVVHGREYIGELPRPARAGHPARMGRVRIGRTSVSGITVSPGVVYHTDEYGQPIEGHPGGVPGLLHALPGIASHAAGTLYRASPFPSAIDAFRHPDEFIGGHQARVEAQNRRQATAFSAAAEAVTGYRQIRAIHQHPVSGGVALASLLPIGRVGKLAEMVGRGVESARTTEQATQHILQAAETARAQGHGVLGPGIEAFKPGETGSAGEPGARVRNALSGHVDTSGMGRYEAIGAKLDAPSAAQARAEQQALGRVERGRRAGAAGSAFEKAGGGLEGHYASLGALKGELPKVSFDALRGLDQGTVDGLINHIQSHPNLQAYEKIRAQGAVVKMLGGQVPNKSETLLLYRVFGKNATDSLRAAAPPSKSQKFWSVLNVPRALMASFDLSAPFRQGLMAVAARPGMTLKNLAPMVRAFGSEKTYSAFMQSIEERATYPLMKKAGLALTDISKGAELTAPEEAFMGGGLAEKIPVIGRGVRASDRAYTGFLNKTRADYFDQLVHSAAAAGADVNDEHVLQSIARYINSATGRGDLGALQKHAVSLNTLLFSPRLLASRLNFLNPLYYAKLDPFARREAFRSAAHLVMGLTTALYIAKEAGAKVSMDPRNADFGKIRIGNTRIDLAGGFQQPIRLVAEMLSGEIVSSTTGRKESLSGGGFGAASRLDIFMRFFQSKEAPVASLVTDMLRGKTFTGQPLSLKSEIAGHVTPLMLQDAWSVRSNPLEAAGVGALSASGIGVQSYGPRDTQQQALDKLLATSKQYLPNATVPDLVQKQAMLQAHFNDLTGSGASYMDKLKVAEQLFYEQYGKHLDLSRVQNQAQAQGVYEKITPALWGQASHWESILAKLQSWKQGQSPVQPVPAPAPAAPAPAPAAPATTPSSYHLPPAPAHQQQLVEPLPSLAPAVQPVSYTPPPRTMPLPQPTHHPMATANPALDAAVSQAMDELAAGTYDPTRMLQTLFTTLATAPVQSSVVDHTGQRIVFTMPKLSGPVGKSAKGAIALAQHFLGTRYVFGGESPSGFDCSGLLQYIWSRMGVRIPRTTYDQWRAGRPVGRGQLRPGDAVFFKGSDARGGLPGHVGIYIGNGRMIDAPHTGSVVRIDRVSSFGGYQGARRFSR